MSTEKRDENVHKHLLRELRGNVAHALGANLQGEKPTNAGVLEAAVTEACIELDTIAEILDLRAQAAEKRDSEDPLGYVVRSLRNRLDLALQLGEGLFDPDQPFVTASAIGYYPGGYDEYARDRAAKREEGGAP